MKVRIVCYEDPQAWILGKFALKLEEECLKLGVDISVGQKNDPEADINHHIIYLDYISVASSIDTLMITHVDSVGKTRMLKQQLEHAGMGICMSEETVLKLQDLGVPPEKLCYVNPAHDNIMAPRKTVLGISSKIHSDGRKKGEELLKIADAISPLIFKFKIMGQGWDKIINQLREKSFEVEYFSQFDYQEYLKFIPSLDYFFYLSHDEGSMGFLDALACGVETIVTPQGYHLDATDGISYAVNDTSDVINTLQSIQNKRLKLMQAVQQWTWKDYAQKHIDIWMQLKQPNTKISNRYTDGVNSINLSNSTSVYTKLSQQVAMFKSSVFFFFYPFSYKSIFNGFYFKKIIKRLIN